MKTSLLFLLILTTMAFTDHVHSQSIHASKNPVPVGSNITLSSNTTVTLGGWMFKGSLLVLIYPGGHKLSKAKGDRAKFYYNTSILTITSARLEDSGVYKLEQMDEFSFELQLSVLEPISNVTLSPQSVNLVELNDTAILTCSVSTGSSLSYKWLTGNSTISSGAGVELKNGGATLSIAGLTRYNQGPYRCNVSNGIGFEVSHPINLNISYGPSNTTLMVMPVKSIYRSGSNITLLCSSDSSPTAKIQWMFNETYLNQRGSQLDLQNVKENTTGTYKCVLYNTVTMKSSSKSTEIRVMDPLTAVVRSHTSGPAILGARFSLQCQVTGPVGTIQWWKNGSLITPNNRTVFDMDNKTLTLNPVQRSDGGLYMCHAFNLVSNMTSSPFAVIVNYGPEMPTITRSNVLMSGNNVTLSCAAESVPRSLYRWYFNGILVSNMSEYMTPPLTEGISGQYVCMALNNITGKNSTASIVLRVVDGPLMPYIMGPDMAMTRDNVTFTCSAESVPPSLYKWYFNGTLVSNMSENTATALSVEMSGKYIFRAFNSISEKNSTVTIMLAVIDPIRWVQIKPQMNPAVEGHSYDLTCSVNGTVDHIYWMSNGKKLYPDNRTLILMDNMTVRFMSIHRNNSGDYNCMAINILGNMTSMTFKLVVNYGPMMAAIMGAKVVKSGNNVTLRCTAESEPQSLYRWYFNGTLVSNMSEYMTPPLTEGMNRTFICMAINKISGKNSTASTMLTVIAPIKQVRIDVSTSPAVEHYSYALNCTGTGTIDHIYWMKNGEKLHPDNSTVFSMNNKTVMFMPVDRYDAGNYKCMAINAVENLTSTAYMLHVNFGPDKPIINGSGFGEKGRDAVFYCSATSMPSSNYTWWFNNSLVANTSKLIVGPLSFNMSGKYTCMAHNYVTGKNSTNSTMLTVIEAIESVMTQGNTTPINNKNFTLLCQIVGPYDTIYWLKDGMQLNMNNSYPNSSKYIIEKNKLHFTPLTRQNNGTYQCVATNKAAHHKSPQYTLLVNYGPLNVYITGPEKGKDGATVSLKCTADSQPECVFQWFFNISTTPLGNGSTINFVANTGKEGKFTCIAKNPVTNITMMQSKMFAIEDHASASFTPNKGALLLMGLCSFFTHLLFL